MKIINKETLLSTIVFCLIVIGCKKDNNKSNLLNDGYDYETYANIINESTGAYSYTDKGATKDNMINNYLANSEGRFSININEVYDEIGKEWVKISDFGGEIINFRTGVEKKVSTAYIKINNNKLFPNLFGTDYLYFYYDSDRAAFADYQEYKDILFPLIYNPSAKFELFDLEENKIIEFITHTPKPLKANFTYKNLVRGNITGAVLKWDSDPNNKIGVFISFTSFGFDGSVAIDYHFLEDDGSEDISQLLNDYAQKSIGTTTIKMKRGFILLGEGKDGLTYKFNAITEFNYNIAI